MRREFVAILAHHDRLVIDAHNGRAFVGLKALHTIDFSAHPGDGTADAIAVTVWGDDGPEAGGVVTVGTTDFPLHQGLPAFRGALAHLLLRVTPPAQAGTGRQREGDTQRGAEGRPADALAPCGVAGAAVMG